MDYTFNSEHELIKGNQLAIFVMQEAIEISLQSGCLVGAFGLFNAITDHYNEQLEKFELRNKELSTLSPESCSDRPVSVSSPVYVPEGQKYPGTVQPPQQATAAPIGDHLNDSVQ